MTIKEALAILLRGDHLTQEQARKTFLDVMSGSATAAQIGALLAALRVKTETSEEIAGAAQAMRSLAVKVDTKIPNLVDTCGTGGSGKKLFNISTSSAFVAAAAGAYVAKHGNRKMSSNSGSANLLESAGVDINLTPNQIANCIQQVGIGFIFAQLHHNAMKYAAPIRTEIGSRTIMNVLGPLTNPASARNQVIGIFDSTWQKKIAEVSKLLGSSHVLIVHSEGLDEISLEKPTTIVELKDGLINDYEISPTDFGISFKNHKQLTANSPKTSLDLVKQSLTQPDSAAADIVSLNAGAAIYAAGVATNLNNGVLMAQDAIASGLAYEKFNELIRITQLMTQP